MNDEMKKQLEIMEFEEKTKGQWTKNLEDGKTAYWDFRKIPKGRFYVGINSGGFEPELDAKARPEYIGFRNLQGTNHSEKPEIIPPNNKHDGGDIVLRGNETDITRVVSSRRLDMIAKASKDTMGEGILYHNLGKQIGLEPSAELIDMIVADMGGIKTEIVESGLRHHIDIDNGDEYQTYFAIVRATDTITNTTGLGSSEEIIDFTEMKKQGRTFALTKAIRKAERNAKERLIPVPRKALVELIKDLMEKNKKPK